MHPHIGALVIGDEILSGKRKDAHLPHLIETLAQRALMLAYAHYIGDDRDGISALLRETFARGDIVFSFGGVGATPDDQTRQAAAAALGLPLERHPEAVASIEAQFGEAAYPYRVLMAEFPAGASIIPNPVNRVAAFSARITAPVVSRVKPTMSSSCLDECGSGSIWSKKNSAYSGQWSGR